MDNQVNQKHHIRIVMVVISYLGVNTPTTAITYHKIPIIRDKEEKEMENGDLEKIGNMEDIKEVSTASLPLSYPTAACAGHLPT